MKPFFAIWLIALLSAIYLLGCGKPVDKTSAKRVFRMNISGALASLDPAYCKDQPDFWMTTQIFEGLVRLDSGLVPQPLLAKRWEISPDGKVYTFILRNNAFFQPHPVFGNTPRRCVARDFVYSFQRVMDEATASPGRSTLHGRVTALEAPNDTTFIIRLAAPLAPFLQLLTTPYTFVVPHEVVAHYGKDFGKHPIGTGTFRLFRWDEGNRLILHRHQPAAASMPYAIDAVSVSFISNKISVFVAFTQSQLDFLNDLDDSYKDEILTKEGTITPEYASRYRIQQLSQLNTEYLAFNTEKPLPLAVRRAIAYAIDRKGIVKYLRNGMGYAAHSGFIPLAMPGFDSVAVPGYEYSPEKARKLLAEAGYANRNPLAGMTLHATQSTSRLAEYLQKSFEKVGMPIQIEASHTGKALRTLAIDGQISLWRASCIADYAEGESYMSLFYSKNIPNPNRTRFANRAFDALYEETLRTIDAPQRQALCRQMDAILLAELPIIPLYYDRSIRLTQPNIRGLSPNAMNMLYLDKVEKLTTE